MRNFTTIALAVLTIATPSIAMAAATTGTALRYDDLDLTSAAGKAELDSRIKTVAARICKDQEQTGTRLPSRECVDGVRAEIAEKLAARQQRFAGGK